MQSLSLFPLSFWVALFALVGFACHAWNNRSSGVGLPTLAVLATVAVWYVGDAFYNDYTSLRIQIGDPNLNAAWWEVSLFVVTFGSLTPSVHRALNQNLFPRSRGSRILQMVKNGAILKPCFQEQIDRLGKALAILWAVLMAIALVRTNFDFRGLFMPYLGLKAEPWGRGRLGGGLDALLAFAVYFEILLTATVGVVAALSKRPRTRFVALAIYLLTIPTFVFDRTRNSMLATLLPGLLSWTFLRFRAPLVLRLLVLVASFSVLDSWMKFVIENRSEASIAATFGDSDRWAMSKDAKHLGLNMFEELSWINLFLENGSYRPNWGQRYFAELVNPIPRALWKGKPMIGIDYAIARGQGSEQFGDEGVAATVSTGMIGQGVVNFGRVLGPVAAALIMAFWVALLARQDLLGTEMGRLLLYLIGLVLTFNMGRDITLLVTYPFCFGYLLLKVQKDTTKSTRPVRTLMPLRPRASIK